MRNGGCEEYMRPQAEAAGGVCTITTLLIQAINVAKPLAYYVYRVSRLLRTCVKRFTSRFSKKNNFPSMCVRSRLVAFLDFSNPGLAKTLILLVITVRARPYSWSGLYDWVR